MITQWYGIGTWYILDENSGDGNFGEISANWLLFHQFFGLFLEELCDT